MYRYVQVNTNIALRNTSISDISYNCCEWRDVLSLYSLIVAIIVDLQ